MIAKAELGNLNKLAKKLRASRKSNGALSLASLEIRFNIDSETHDPINVEAKQVLETNSLVEEFMLLANCVVAQRIYEEFPSCALLRRHPVPPTSNYEPLVKAAASRGFEILVDSGPALSQSLERAKLPDNPYFNTMLRILTTRCMTQAVYFCAGSVEKKQFYHFGLASPIYTHFTSPIRRYADLMVHRFLASAIHAHDTYSEMLDFEKQESLCRNLNYRHKQAQLASRASVLSNTHLFFKNKREDLEAYILGVRRNALQVLVPKYGLESAVLLKKGQHPFTYDEQNGALTFNDICLRMFDKVTVQLSVDDTDPQHYKLKLQLVEPKVDNFSVEPLFDISADDDVTNRRENEQPVKKFKK
uniref:Ribonuclease II/R domain-containing protein n=1 Tax=Romanomermis culicivorax TaxID=13658 RepID=A0A915JEX0_ROMCU